MRKRGHPFTLIGHVDTVASLDVFCFISISNTEEGTSINGNSNLSGVETIWFSSCCVQHQWSRTRVKLCCQKIHRTQSPHHSKAIKWVKLWAGLFRSSLGPHPTISFFYIFLSYSCVISFTPVLNAWLFSKKWTYAISMPTFSACLLPTLF